jgi:hypothetical protein
VAGAGQVIHQQHGTTLHRQRGQLNLDCTVAVALLAAHRIGLAVAGGLRNPRQRLFMGPDQHHV